MKKVLRWALWMALFCAGFLWAQETTGAVDMSGIKEAWQPVIDNFLKFLAVLVVALIMNILTILRNQVKDNIFKRKFLDWAIAKAIKLAKEKSEQLTNSEKWEELVKKAAKLGVTEAMMKKHEAEIMAGVEKWNNLRS